MIKHNPVTNIFLKLILVLRKNWENTEVMVTHATINKSWCRVARVGNFFFDVTKLRF